MGNVGIIEPILGRKETWSSIVRVIVEVAECHKEGIDLIS
jgi:hypothetical protein